MQKETVILIIGFIVGYFYNYSKIETSYNDGAAYGYDYGYDSCKRKYRIED